jgi:hypothetical protein
VRRALVTKGLLAATLLLPASALGCSEADEDGKGSEKSEVANSRTTDGSGTTGTTADAEAPPVTDPSAALEAGAWVEPVRAFCESETSTKSTIQAELDDDDMVSAAAAIERYANGLKKALESAEAKLPEPGTKTLDRVIVLANKAKAGSASAEEAVELQEEANLLGLMLEPACPL